MKEERNGPKLIPLFGESSTSHWPCLLRRIPPTPPPIIRPTGLHCLFQKRLADNITACWNVNIYSKTIRDELSSSVMHLSAINSPSLLWKHTLSFLTTSVALKFHRFKCIGFVKCAVREINVKKYSMHKCFSFRVKDKAHPYCGFLPFGELNK